MEKRLFNLADCDLRREGTSKNPRFVFTGHAAMFNKLSSDLGGFREKVAPGAFSRSLTAGADVRFLVNHDPNLLLGRTASKTLKVFEDVDGLRVEAELPDTSYARDLAVLMERGDLNQMSFAFRTVKDSWDKQDGKQIRTLDDVDLLDVSAVTYPAYPETSADLEQRMIATALNEVRAGAALSAKNREVIEAAIASLKQMLVDADGNVTRAMGIDQRERDFLFRMGL